MQRDWICRTLTKIKNLNHKRIILFLTRDRLTLQQSSKITTLKVPFCHEPLRLLSSPVPHRMGTLKGLCWLDLQKRYCSEDSWERWKTGRDLPCFTDTIFFYMQPPLWYLQTFQAANTTVHPNTHFDSPLQSSGPRSLMQQVTPGRCHAEKDHLHPAFCGHCQQCVPEPSCLILVFTLFMLIWQLL